MVVRARPNFTNKMLGASEKARRFAFLRNGFTPVSALNKIRNKQRKQNIVVGCAEGVKTILEAEKSLCLKQSCILCFKMNEEKS